MNTTTSSMVALLIHSAEQSQKAHRFTRISVLSPHIMCSQLYS